MQHINNSKKLRHKVVTLGAGHTLTLAGPFHRFEFHESRALGAAFLGSFFDKSRKCRRESATLCLRTRPPVTEVGCREVEMSTIPFRRAQGHTLNPKWLLDGIELGERLGVKVRERTRRHLMTGINQNQRRKVKRRPCWNSVVQCRGNLSRNVVPLPRGGPIRVRQRPLKVRIRA